MVGLMAASGNHKGVWVEFQNYCLVPKELSVQWWRPASYLLQYKPCCKVTVLLSVLRLTLSSKN